MKYYQSSGELHFENGTVLKGHAGIFSLSNNPDAQHLKDEGPLPRGFYTMTVRTTKYRTLWPPIIILTPCHGNQMFNRDGFMIHGGGERASTGCIIIDGKARRELIVDAIKAGDTRLQVVR